MIAIEKNIPLPSISEQLVETLAKMEVGDSFLLGNANINQRETLYRRIRQAAPSKYITRSVEGGTRVWRTK